jgi:hypothetical protein
MTTSSRCRWAAPAKVLPARAAKADFTPLIRDPEGNKLNAFVMG